ncbi:MAG: glycerate 2-kinase [Blastocatellia bacterium]
MTDLEKAARSIFFETLRAVDISAMIRRRVRLDGDLLWFDEKLYDLSRFTEVILLGIGKASLQMGYAIESLLGTRLTRGLLVTNRREPLRLRSEIIVAGHPVPDAHSLRAGKRALEILANSQPDSLVIFLISGGGSSLFEVPLSDDITLEDLQQLNRILVECGATIEEINVVRKQFSGVKGGKLRKWINARETIALLVSDVNAGDFKTLASNPLFPEEKTVEQFQAIVEGYKLADKLPHLFQRFQSRSHPADPKFDESRETRIETILLAENADVVNAAGGIARNLGYVVWVDRADNEEPYEKTASRLISTVAELKRVNPDHKVCVVSGGEVSCPVKGQGFGGRNQEFVLHCAMRLKEALLADSLVLSCGTDGIDGRSVAVGAIAHASQTESCQMADSELRHYFQASDTTSWFNESGGMLVTGPTGNNLRDLRVILSS